MLLAADAEDVEHLRLEVVLVDPERAAADLDAVQREVVGVGLGGTRIGRQQVLVAGTGTGERVMDGAEALLALVPLEHREVRDPAGQPEALVDQPELAAQMEAQVAEDARDHRRRRRTEHDRGARLAADGVELDLRQELGDRRADLARRVEQQMT